MKKITIGSNKKWVQKVVIAASIAILPLAANPTMGYAQYIETDAKLVDALTQKHAEVDAYLFKDKADELAERGIHVTNTGPIGNFIEIGIKDYSDEKADYLYEAFGTELVKVVDGLQAVTLAMPAEPVMSITSIDVDVPENAEMGATSIDIEVPADAELGVTNADTPSADTAADSTVRTIADHSGGVAASEEAAPSAFNTPWIIAAAAFIVGGVALLTRKLSKAKK